MQNNIGRHITIAEMAPHVHSFLPNENKVDKIVNWLVNWIEISLKDGKIKSNDFLPTKGELAFHIGVSLGTIQNVFRIIEDRGIIESRQKVGSYIKNNEGTSIEKLTSKREVAINEIKKYIKNSQYKVNEVLISSRKLSKLLNIPFGTINIAINSLISDNILEKNRRQIIIKKIDFNIKNIETKTLVEKTAEHIVQYINNNLKTNDKLPSNLVLADMFKVSIKTINDSIKYLSELNIVKTRRGYYGTIVINGNEDQSNAYFYKQVEASIKKYILENCKIGSKLPTISNFAEIFNVSSKTIKNALNNLADEEIIVFHRGRYGGSFVINIPTINEKAYEWLALSPEFKEM